MKNQKKGFVLGFITCALLFSLVMGVFAAPIYKTIEVIYDNIKINIDDKEVTPKDANGNVVEPFNYNGTIYLPIRAVGEALGKEVSYDSKTKTAFLKPKVDTTPVTETKTYEGRIEKNGDVNTYDFKLPYAARVTVDFEHGFVDSSNEYWSIQFVSKSGIAAEFSSKGNVVNEKLSHAIYLPEDDYTIRVKQRGSGAHNHSNVDYKVKVTYEKNIGQFEYEPNNTTETATSSEFNKSIKGNLLSNGDVDVYKLSVTSKKEISLKFTHEFVDSSVDYWKIELISPNDGVLSTIYSKGNISETISDKITLIDSGDYYIKISQRGSGAHNNCNVDYTITVN